MSSPAPPYVPKRGRPSKSRVEAIDRTILDAACRLFLESGALDQVTMEGVAFVAGVSKSSLYARYSTKEDLLAAVAADRIRVWARDPADFTQDSGGSLAGLLRAHARHLAMSFANPEIQAMQRLLMNVGDRLPPATRAVLDGGYSQAIEQMAADLKTAPGGESIDARSVASVTVSAIIGWQTHNWGREDFTTRSLVAFADRVVDLLIEGQAAW